jgi:hypothetical protein
MVGALGLGRLELGRDQRVILGTQINLIVKVGCGHRALKLVIGDESLLLLEGLDLLDRDLQLMGDPRIGAALPDPGADLIELRS